MTARYSLLLHAVVAYRHGTKRYEKSTSRPPARTDSFTGVSTGNTSVPAGGSSVELPPRHGIDLKFNKYISRESVSHTFGSACSLSTTTPTTMWSTRAGPHTDVKRRARSGGVQASQFVYGAENKSAAVWARMNSTSTTG